MDVSKRYTSVLVLLVSCLALSCNTQSADEVTDDEVLELAREKVAAATARLGERIEECAAEAEANSPPVIDKATVQKHKIRQEELMVALSYLSFRNSFECEKESRLSMSYALGTLAAAQQHFNQIPVAADEISQGLIYPPVDQLRYEVRYLRLESGFREYLEKSVGEAPFDLFEALDKNELLPD